MNILNDIFNMGRKAPEAGATPLETAAGAPPPIPTATELEALPALLEKHLGPFKTGPNSYDRQPSPGVPPEVYRIVAGTLPEPLLTVEQIAAVRMLHTERELAVRSLAECGRDKVKGAFAAHQAAIGEAEIEGKPLPDSFSREEIAADLQSRARALKSACRERSIQMCAIFAEGAGKLVAHVRTHGEQVALREFRDFAKYQIDYVPSALVRMLLHSAAKLEQITAGLPNKQGPLGTDVKGLFAMIGIDL